MKPYIDQPLTVDDLEGAPDDGNRYEVIEGELHVSSAPSYLHQAILLRLVLAFGRYLEGNPIGEISVGIGVIFDQFNGVIPDFVFFSHERKQQLLKNGRLTGAPELVVEILSPGSANSNRDRRIKRALYSSRGVSEYWLVDPETRSIEVHRKRREGGLEFSMQFQAEDVLTTPLLPSFHLTIAPLFA